MLSDKPWKPEAVVRLALAVLICVFGGALLASLARRFLGAQFDISPWRVVAAALTFQGAALVLAHRFIREHGTRWKEAFGFGNDWKRAVLAGTIFAVLFLPIGIGLQLVITGLLEHFNVHLGEQQAVRAFKDTAGLPDAAALVVVAIVLAPLAEEVLFRGILYPAVKQLGFPRLALWGSSLVFAAIHWNLPTFIPLLLLSLAFTLLYEKTNNLLAPIAAHLFFNTLNLVMLYFAEVFNRIVLPT